MCLSFGPCQLPWREADVSACGRVFPATPGFGLRAKRPLTPEGCTVRTASHSRMVARTTTAPPPRHGSLREPIGLAASLISQPARCPGTTSTPGPIDSAIIAQRMPPCKGAAALPPAMPFLVDVRSDSRSLARRTLQIACWNPLRARQQPNGATSMRGRRGRRARRYRRRAAPLAHNIAALPPDRRGILGPPAPGPEDPMRIESINLLTTLLPTPVGEPIRRLPLAARLTES
jgi:hypothetical protein